MRVQAQLASSIPHIEALVGSVVGDDWLEKVNRDRDAEGRRPYREASGDERAALALFAHAPGVRDRWPAAARAASQLGGILNAAHHNDADRWNKGDEVRVAQLAQDFQTFLAEHPAELLASSWSLTVEFGVLPARKRVPVVERRHVHSGHVGQSLTQLLGQAVAAHNGDALTTALLGVVTPLLARADADGHARVESRDTTVSPTSTVSVVVKRSDTSAAPVTATLTF